jgi:hypothetical protein
VTTAEPEKVKTGTIAPDWLVSVISGMVASG